MENQYVVPIECNPITVTLKFDEPDSRYKMEQLQIQSLGSSKMTKSVFVNIHKVAKDLHVPPSYILHFFGYENGARAELNPKKIEREQATISGQFILKDLSKTMVKFLKEVVLCSKCSLPELKYEIQNGNVCGTCRSCRHSGILPITNTKFKNYVLKNPPTSEGGAFDNKVGVQKKQPEVRKDKREKKNQEKSSVKKQLEDEFPEVEEDDNEVWFSDTSEEAMKLRKQQLGVTDPSEVLYNFKENEKKVEKEKKEEVKPESPEEKRWGKEFPKGCDFLKVAQEKQSVLRELFILSSESQKLFLDHLSSSLSEKEMAKAPVIVKGVYDLDLLEEDNILEWCSESNSKMKDSLAPLVKWFQEAEEESDDE